MKPSRIIFLITGVVFSFYLLFPTPELPPSDLPESVKSDLPGDTIQINNVAAYFTSQTREQVTQYYKDYFSKSPFFNLPLITVVLNHPPEYSKEIISDTIQSYYFIEIVHPFRGSLYVNGFDWENDVFTPPARRKKNKLIYQDKVWPTKVTLRWFYSKPIIRLMIFWASWTATWAVTGLFIQSVKNFINLIRKK